MTANELKDLIRMGRPYKCGQPYSRAEIIEEIERRGHILLKELGWPINNGALYRNRHTRKEKTLFELLGSPNKRLRRDETLWHNLFSVIEHYSPAVSRNLI